MPSFTDKYKDQCPAILDQLASTGTLDYNQIVQPATAELPTFLVDDLPEVPSIGRFCIVLDDVGGVTPAYGDGANWLRVADRAVISKT